ncbi:ribonuclease III [Burkholderia sp. WAC0059]|uniref:ribonuclease III n=1 Tax=Burkholderia sp. WAC0059 TaxID=2066022 RepID=UPI000C7E9F9F|nr:ribonuclease III [Burkholderia sp. WAC0059]PLZ02503.1 ribonuclease III [Burkholderia sp. WAC0059]
MPLSPLESRLRYEFRNAELLRQALTHRSHSATHNERLEFLGDSVLNCAVAALLFQRFGKLDEGDLSRVRANLVKQQSLYEIAQALNIADSLRLGEGELRSGGFRRPSILADALEAVFGAIFVDGGFDAAQTVIKRLYVPILDHIDPRTLGKDSKTLLQEYLQGHKIALPTYTVIATHGAAHNQQFEVECTVPKLDVKVSGSGASRRAAEQAAAKKALEEVMAAAPAPVAKPKRSKGARAAKAEPEVVPGVTGIQGALDLRSPERRERASRSGERPVVVVAEESAPAAGDVERAMAAAVPLALIRAAHVEYSQERGGEKGEAGERPTAGKTDAPGHSAADRPAEKSAEKVAEKAAPLADGVPAVTAVPRGNAAKAESAAARGGERTAERPARVRDAASVAGATDDAGLDAAGATTALPAVLPARAADAGH